MHIAFSKKYILSLCFIILILSIIPITFLIRGYEQNIKYKNFGDILYKVLIRNDVNEEEKIASLSKIAESNVEPYASIANIHLADIYQTENKMKEFSNAYSKIINNSNTENFIKSLAEIKILLLKSSEIKNMKKDIYYFTYQIIEILNELEHFDKIENTDEIKSKIFNLRDSVAAPRNIKNVAKELAKLYFYDYNMDFSSQISE